MQERTATHEVSPLPVVISFKTFRSSEIPSKDQISALAQELEVQKMQTLSYMEQSHSLKSKLQECEERIHKSSADIHVYKV